jgi:hypothetical protein
MEFGIWNLEFSNLVQKTPKEFEFHGALSCCKDTEMEEILSGHVDKLKVEVINNIPELKPQTLNLKTSCLPVSGPCSPIFPFPGVSAVVFLLHQFKRKMFNL